MSTSHSDLFEDQARRVAAILNEAGLSPPEQIPTLRKPDFDDFEASLPSNIDDARSLLIQQRTSEPDNRPPGKQKRHIFRWNRTRDAKSETESWNFTIHEVAKAFDNLFSRAPLPAPGVAQAILSHASVVSVQELWYHFCDSKYRPKFPRLSAIPQKTASSWGLDIGSYQSSKTPKRKLNKYPCLTWLDKACDIGNLEYIRLMCQTGLSQDILAQAFEIALSKNAIDVMEVLLSFDPGASSTSQSAIRERVCHRDVPLVRLLLSAPNAMSIEAWRLCLQPLPLHLPPPDPLLLCLAHRPNVACRELLNIAIASQSPPATAIILAYGHFSRDSIGAFACIRASSILDHKLRYEFFKLLVACGLVTDDPISREELMKDVRARQLPLIKLLAHAGVLLDIETPTFPTFGWLRRTPEFSPLSWAVQHMDLDILECFKSGKFSSPISMALKLVPESTPEPDILRFVQILGPTGLDVQWLNSWLIRAVRNKNIDLVEALIRHGALVEFEEASSVKTALKNSDFDMLNVLLQNECSPTILSSTIPTAMALKPRPVRLQAMEALVKKGVLPQDLIDQLGGLTLEDEDLDSQLIQFLLQYAPGFRPSDRSVLSAAYRGNLAILGMLCDAGPSSKTMSEAVQVAFAVKDTHGYDLALDMIKLLLRKGAAGEPIDFTLLDAVRTDSRLEIIRVLLEHGADANFLGGLSFEIALRQPNFRLLQVLCEKCPPSQSSIESLLFVAIDPQYYEPEALELLLSSSPSTAAALNALPDFSQLGGIPPKIIRSLLRHGLDATIGDGALLGFAIEENDVELLNTILSGNPSILWLTAAFSTAVESQTRSNQLYSMRRLLEAAKSAEIGQSPRLLQETCLAKFGDTEGVHLLLSHGASISLDDFALAYFFIAYSSILSVHDKERIFELLYATSPVLSVENMSELLTENIGWFNEYGDSVYPDYILLQHFLLAKGAEVKFEDFKNALKIPSWCSCESWREEFTLLVKHAHSTDVVLKTFRYFWGAGMYSEEKCWAWQLLLDQGLPTDDVSQALLELLKTDDLGYLSLQKLLLEYGASPGHQNGEAFYLALEKSPDFNVTVRLLVQYIVNDNMATAAFRGIRRIPSLKQDVLEEICRPLLEWNIEKDILSQALVERYKNGGTDVSFLQLLLAKGADPNQDDGYCFGVAALKGGLAEFRALSRNAKPQAMLKALLRVFHDEPEIIRWYKVFLEEQPQVENTDQDMLFQCIHKFPQRTTLLTLLLNAGVSPNAKTNYSLCGGWKPEPCTALIRALLHNSRSISRLFAQRNVKNNVILCLLSRGDVALSTYSTPVTKVSAAFICLLEKKRLPILQALLELDRGEMSCYVIPGSSFGPLAMWPRTFEEDSGLLGASEELTLPLAALYLGNFEAFCLLAGEMNPNDGMLHLAALLALPKFVKHLLKTHDPDQKSEEFDNMVPLACACASKPQLWCKIANKESDWKDRQKETMQLLAGVTSPNWRYRNMTILHYAMENGLETAKAMVEALDIRSDPERDEKYLYVDRDGNEYSPQQYVLKVWHAEADEWKDLITCLEGARLQSRYFKRVMPGEGQQPEGYHGLPPPYASAWL